jgi:hypothetical protein
MYKLVIAAVCIAMLVCCNATQSSEKNKSITPANNSLEAVEGKDYIILKRFRLQDNQGFSQPIEASSFLLPANWKVDGGIQWNAGNKCLAEIVQASLQATSPDGEYELLLFPVTQFDWSDDPVYLDAMQRGFNLHSCNIAQPQDAAGYIRNTLAPYVKVQVTAAKIIPALQQQMDDGAAQMTQQARMAGNEAYSHRGSAAEGLLQFTDGKQGMAFCTLMQTIVTLPGTQGQIANTFQCYVSMRIVIKYSPGKEDKAQKIMSTFFSSTRINPTWWNGLQNFFIAAGKNAQDQTWKHIQEVRDVQQQMGNNIIRNWEAKNSQSNNANSPSGNTDAFGQYLRGVENYTDENGNTVELTSGYGNAWSKGDGTYLLTTNPTFDPNVELGGTQSWGKMKQ